MRLLAHVFAFCALLALGVQPIAAQSILRDAETEDFLKEISAPLVEVAGLEPGNVDIVLINDPSINAFVTAGQTVYLHSGLIDAADTANEVQGVIAHELGHITGGHVSRRGEGMAAANRISILSLIAGLGAALAGAGDAAMGVMMAGQRAALGAALAYNRGEESSADAAGAQYLSDAGISGRGSIAFFKKLQNQEFRYGYSQSGEAAFTRTHPLSGDRIARLRDTYQADPAWEAPDNARVEQRFRRIKAKLSGYLEEPRRTLNSFPASDTSVPARYARAYAYHKDARVELALAETASLIAQDPDDPYFLELRGQVLLESGRADEALVSLRRATEMTRAEPLIASLFGHALIATENKENYAEAEEVLRAAVARDRYNPFAWYQLGVVYAARGDLPRARLASAEQQVMNREYAMALRSAQAAEAGLPENTPDWLRAQDIGMQARALIEQQSDRNGGRR
ncbi:peptidase M48 [Erythrobacter sp. QSSC1-22B]|uniref:M48 family metalloprotease n=1 Tax=Erythrobacter sp. QSSC1-22B TaxID=1860125 RepID=UPI000805ACC5|nr:M48 family metalloprotease [Erythrobacter sp. QSSC1-22B]OBX20059.1 peptidase M48 [Erythrobacter sp. QSSC1-22B]